jgi:hypothetical protein
LASRTARKPRPLPTAMSGASGPSTTPKLRVASAANTIPGSSTGNGAPAGLNPSAGEWPPAPGRYLIVSPTSTPDTTSSGSGHHGG